MSDKESDHHPMDRERQRALLEHILDIGLPKHTSDMGAQQEGALGAWAA